MSPGDLPNPGMELGSAALQADSLQTELPGSRQRLREQCESHKEDKAGLCPSGSGPLI